MGLGSIEYCLKVFKKNKDHANNHQDEVFNFLLLRGCQKALQCDPCFHEIVYLLLLKVGYKINEKTDADELRLGSGPISTMSTWINDHLRSDLRASKHNSCSCKTRLAQPATISMTLGLWLGHFGCLISLSGLFSNSPKYLPTTSNQANNVNPFFLTGIKGALFLLLYSLNNSAGVKLDPDFVDLFVALHLASGPSSSHLQNQLEHHCSC